MTLSEFLCLAFLVFMAISAPASFIWLGYEMFRIVRKTSRRKENQ